MKLTFSSVAVTCLVFALSATAQDLPIERIDRIQTNPPIVVEGQGFELFVLGNGNYLLDRPRIEVDHDAKFISIKNGSNTCGTAIGQLDLPNQSVTTIPPLDSGTYTIDLELFIPFGCRSVEYQGEVEVLPLDLLIGPLVGRTPIEGGPAVLAEHEVPGPGQVMSGVSLLRGWACYNSYQSWPRIGRVTFSLNGGDPVVAPYGMSRLDTQEKCFNQAQYSGYGFVMNWNLLPPGENNIKLYIDDVLFEDLNFTVVNLGEQYITGLSAEYLLEAFPRDGESTTIKWSTASQGFVITEHNRE